MKKKVAVLLTCALAAGLMLSGCTTQPKESQTPPPEAFRFTRENMPRLDGSTSTAPLAEAVCAVLLGESRDEVSDLVQFNKTTTAYYNLMEGKADLLIVGEANADVLAAKGVKVYKTFVGEYMTSIEMAGFSISLLKLDGQLKGLLDAKADTPGFKA